MISEIEAKPLDLRVKCEPDEVNSESDDAEDIKPIYKGYKKCIIKQFRKFCTPDYIIISTIHRPYFSLIKKK